jgi:hypothetical protein
MAGVQRVRDMTGPGHFRSRGVEVTAMQWTGDNGAPIRAWMNRLTAHQYGFGIGHADGQAHLWVVKSDAWCEVEIGDWIVAEPDGDGHYPVKGAVFADRYEPIELAHVPIDPAQAFNEIANTIQRVLGNPVDPEHAVAVGVPPRSTWLPLSVRYAAAEAAVRVVMAWKEKSVT